MLLPHKSTQIHGEVYDTRKATLLAEGVVIHQVTVPRGLTHTTTIDQSIYSQLFRTYDGMFLYRTAKRDASTRVYDDGLFPIPQEQAEIHFDMLHQIVGYDRAFQWGNRRRRLADTLGRCWELVSHGIPRWIKLTGGAGGVGGLLAILWKALNSLT